MDFGEEEGKITDRKRNSRVTLEFLASSNTSSLSPIILVKNHLTFS